MSVLEKRFLTPEAVYPSLTDNNLRYEIEYQSFLNWWQKNEDSFNNIPFGIEHQVRLFLGQVENEGKETALSSLRMDLYGYYLEYIRQEGVIPFSLRFNNSGRLVGEFYGDKSIVEMVDKRERNGAVWKAMIDLEEKLRKLKEGEIIFRISPSGWTGLGYDYNETQAQILWKDEKGKIRGLTIRTQIQLKEILSIMSLLGANLPPEVLGDEKNLIKYITSLNLICDWSLLKLIQFLTEKFDNQDHKGRDLGSQISKWLHEDYDFEHFDEIAGLINFLEERIKNQVNVDYLTAEEIKEELKGLISFVLVGMVSGRGRFEGDSWEVCFYPGTRFLPDNYYYRAVNSLQSLTGCAGGGSAERGLVLTSFGTVEYTEYDKYGSREFKCPHCHKNVLRPKDELLAKCPYCGKDVSCGKV